MEKIAKALLQIEAVFLSPKKPFTWASGIKSPIYCDNRLTLSYPDVRNEIENGLVDLIKTHYPNAERIIGTSTAGIAHAALVADRMNLPTGYVRGSSKAHGRTNKIEGIVNKGDNVVVVEDLISTAGSVLEVVESLRSIGANVLGIVSIFTYGMQKGIDRLSDSKCLNYSLSSIDELIEVAITNEYITEEEGNAILQFRDNPQDESWFK